jgi:hypothetical protein
MQPSDIHRVGRQTCCMCGIVVFDPGAPPKVDIKRFYIGTAGNSHAIGIFYCDDCFKSIAPIEVYECLEPYMLKNLPLQEMREQHKGNITIQLLCLSPTVPKGIRQIQCMNPLCHGGIVYVVKTFIENHYKATEWKCYSCGVLNQSVYYD